MADTRNMLDPAVQEKVRRGTHEYVTGDGRHGSYVARDYHHREYPKMMDRTPAPNRRKFKNDDDHQAAFKEWEEITNASIVNSKAEEEKWLTEHKTQAGIGIEAATANPQQHKPARPARKPTAQKQRAAAA